MHQVGITLQRYAVLVQALFQGTTAAVHPFVRAIWELTTGFQTRLPFIMERHQGLGLGSALYQAYPARILRTVQIQGYEYLQRIGAITRCVLVTLNNFVYPYPICYCIR